MSTATLISPAADDSDLIAAFAVLRIARVLPRPAFVAELRARLLAEISQLGQKRTEGNPICYDRC